MLRPKMSGRLSYVAKGTSNISINHRYADDNGEKASATGVSLLLVNRSLPLHEAVANGPLLKVR